MQSRRGFLRTLTTAVGLAAFDPISKLWVPQAPKIVGVTLDAAGTGQTLEQAVQKVSDEQAWLNDFAEQVAKQFGERMANYKADGLREVAYKMATGPQSPAPLIDIDGETRLFMPNQRMMETVRSENASVSLFVNTLMRRAHATGTDVFAPMTERLSATSTFDDEMQIGIGVDPESGASVRILRWRQDNHGRYLVTRAEPVMVDGRRQYRLDGDGYDVRQLSKGGWLMGVETSGGRWETKAESQERHARERHEEYKRTHDWDGHKRTPEEQERYERFAQERYDKHPEYNPDDYSR